LRVLNSRVLGDMFGSYTHTKWIQYSTVDYVSSIWGRTKSYWWRIWPMRMLDRKWRHRKSHDLFPYFFSRIFPYFFPVLFFRTFFPRILFPVLFSPYFPRTFFPYYFPVLFQKSRRLKYNVLKYQLVVFLVHVVIRQFMFLAKYPFKRHP
jgi:hypothetical protein